MRIAHQLKALRLMIPGRPGVRAVARSMGHELPNAYGYYESEAFNKDVLPLEKAREIAAAFEKLGGKGTAVLRLAGLADGEVEREVAANPPVQPVFVSMAVAFPDQDAIVAMMRELLIGVGLKDAANQHAVTLAQRLPAALARASSQFISHPHLNDEQLQSHE